MDLSSLTGLLVGVHAALAIRTQTPEMMLTEDEAKSFLKAAQNVMRHYSVSTTQKTLDWIALVGSGGAIYGTRAFAIAARRAGEKAAAEERGTVLNFRRPVRPVPPVSPGAPEAPAAGTPYVPSVVSGDDEFNQF